MNSFKLNSKGVQELLKSDEMASCLNTIGEEVLKATGNDGYSKELYYGKKRLNIEVFAKTKKAKKDNLENNTLLKALGSVRGK